MRLVEGHEALQASITGFFGCTQACNTCHKMEWCIGVTACPVLILHVHLWRPSCLSKDVFRYKQLGTRMIQNNLCLGLSRKSRVSPEETGIGAFVNSLSMHQAQAQSSKFDTTVCCRQLYKSIWACIWMRCGTCPSWAPTLGRTKACPVLICRQEASTRSDPEMKPRGSLHATVTTVVFRSGGCCIRQVMTTT